MQSENRGLIDCRYYHGDNCRFITLLLRGLIDFNVKRCQMTDYFQFIKWYIPSWCDDWSKNGPDCHRNYDEYYLALSFNTCTHSYTHIYREEDAKKKGLVLCNQHSLLNVNTYTQNDSWKSVKFRSHSVIARYMHI